MSAITLGSKVRQYPTGPVMTVKAFTPDMTLPCAVCAWDTGSANGSVATLPIESLREEKRDISRVSGGNEIIVNKKL